MIKASVYPNFAKLLAVHVLDSIHKSLSFQLQIRFGLACLTWHLCEDMDMFQICRKTMAKFVRLDFKGISF